MNAHVLPVMIPLVAPSASVITTTVVIIPLPSELVAPFATIILVIAISHPNLDKTKTTIDHTH
jgi:hypothetical protein